MKKQLSLVGMLSLVVLFSAGCTANDINTLIQLASLIARFV
jgi:hypothetical protein